MSVVHDLNAGSWEVHGISGYGSVGGIRYTSLRTSDERMRFPSPFYE